MSKIIITENSLNYLAEAILHWKENLEAAKAEETFSYHADSCPLCSAYRDCKNCPIKSFTGSEGCYQTPWVHIVSLVIWWRCDSKKFKKPLIEAVKNELDFLKEVYEWLDGIWKRR